MEKKPDLSYDSQVSPGMSLSRVLPLQEDSISLESEDEDDSYHDSINDYSYLHNNTNLYQDESVFQAEIKRLKNESTQRFKSKWEEILYKYSVIDDDKDSDEIDLSTGLIIKDNGHLKSLHSGSGAVGNDKLDGNIWHQDYDVDKELNQKRQNEVRKKKRKQVLKAKLKEQQKFLTISSSDSNLDNQQHNLTNKKRIPPEDNLLQLDPSPTKKHRFTKSSSPIVSDRLTYITPTKGQTPIPRMQISPTKPSRLNHSNVFLDDTTLHISSSTSKESSYMSPQEEETSQTSQPDSSQENTLEESDFESDSQVSETEQADTPKVFPRLSTIAQSDHEYENEEDEASFDDEYSIVLDPLHSDTPDKGLTIYQCAFDECLYCTGNRSLYQNHLLDKHAPELNYIGYPISQALTISPTKVKFNESRLNKQFPLTYPIPPFPESEDGQPLMCNKIMDNNRRCRRAFLMKSNMIHHQTENSCSYKKQVLMCPLLGCGFLTEGGYLEWRAHFIKEKHHEYPVEREISKLEYIESDTSNITEPGHQEIVVIPDNVEDLFSEDDLDSTDFENSADEESVDGEEDESDRDNTANDYYGNIEKYISPIKRQIRHVSIAEPTFTDKAIVVEDHESPSNDSLDELFD